MEFFTGRQSKLAKLMERAIRDHLEVEVELSNKQVIYGQVHSYEFSPSQLIITIATPKNMVVINFREAIKMRIQHKTNSNLALQSKH